jgi:orotate phosphoribosyltransferase
MAKMVLANYPEVTAIVGVATAGIAPGALIADEMQLPFGYVRSEPKKHGMGKQLEGDIAANAKVVVIEDLVSTGKSSLQAVNSLRDNGVEVIGLACIFTYGFDAAQQAFDAAQCPYVSLSNYDVLIQLAAQNGLIQQTQSKVLSDWRANPSTWRQ